MLGSLGNGVVMETICALKEWTVQLERALSNKPTLVPISFRDRPTLTSTLES